MIQWNVHGAGLRAAQRSLLVNAVPDRSPPSAWGSKWSVFEFRLLRAERLRLESNPGSQMWAERPSNHLAWRSIEAPKQRARRDSNPRPSD